MVIIEDPPVPPRRPATLTAGLGRTMASFVIGLRYHEATSLPARKPSAGAVPGR